MEINESMVGLSQTWFFLDPNHTLNAEVFTVDPQSGILHPAQDRGFGQSPYADILPY